MSKRWYFSGIIAVNLILPDPLWINYLAALLNALAWVWFELRELF
jgi:hypothetical protein